MAQVKAAAADELMRHPDWEVRLWSAKCLAEGFRIFAPEPPLDARQLRGTLELFLEQLQGLLEPKGAAFVLVVGLLEQLSQVQAFVLLFECERPEELLIALVDVCIGAARVNKGSRFEERLADLLTSVLSVAGTDDIPEHVLVALIDELKSAVGIQLQFCN
jgi:hypothetical protein